MLAAGQFYPRSKVMARVPLPAHLRKRAASYGGRALVVVRPDEVEWMVRQLKGRGWRSGSELGARSGGQKRKLKAIVEAANGAILHFRGSPGFKLTQEATPAEIRRGIAALRAEARTPLRRMVCYRRHFRSRAVAVTGQLFPADNINRK